MGKKVSRGRIKDWQLDSLNYGTTKYIKCVFRVKASLKHYEKSL